MLCSSHKQIISPPLQHRIPNGAVFSSLEALGCCPFPGVSNTCFSRQPHKPFWQRCLHTAFKAVWKGTEQFGGFVLGICSCWGGGGGNARSCLVWDFCFVSVWGSIHFCGRHSVVNKWKMLLRTRSKCASN